VDSAAAAVAGNEGKGESALTDTRPPHYHHLTNSWSVAGTVVCPGMLGSHADSDADSGPDKEEEVVVGVLDILPAPFHYPTSQPYPQYRPLQGGRSSNSDDTDACSEDSDEDYYYDHEYNHTYNGAAAAGDRARLNPHGNEYIDRYVLLWPPIISPSFTHT
jgi:hypothetical protein